MSRHFLNTKRLSPAGNEFTKTGRYCSYPKNTALYYEFWDEEKRRCLEGFTTAEGDISITGFHYFYLNYTRIQRVKSTTKPDGTVHSERIEGFPAFYDTDFHYFQAVETCRITGKHLAVLKARRKGFSYKAASMMNRNYFLVRHSKNFVFASLKEYLTGVDAILTKTFEMMSFIDDNTAWSQPRSLDRPMEKTSGYRKRVNGQWVQKGFLSSIAGVSLKDDPEKVKGKAGELIFFEEAGSFPELQDAWAYAMPTMRQGDRTLGTMIAFGTGGTSGSGFECLDELFYHPEAYDCLSFPNEWSESSLGTECGFFVPIYHILEGFIDDDGNSITEDARDFEIKERNKKRQGNDPKAYDTYIAEHPFSPEEATLQVSANILNQATLKEQYDRTKVHNLTALGVPGELVPLNGKVNFQPNWELKPILKFPHRKGDDITGCVIVYEKPFTQNGDVPDGLYFICHDPYAQDQATSSSLGAAYVLKRPNKYSQPDDMIVASYVGRPATQDTYNYTLFNLATFYNAKIGFENDRGDVIGYAKRFRRLNQLQPQFEMLQNKDLQSKTVDRGFGMHMTEQRKNQGMLMWRDWLDCKRGRALDDSYTLNVHKIYDPALLQESMKFNNKGNFDRCLSAGTQLQTINGLVAIEDVVEGELVLTHKGRYKPVTRKTYHLSEKMTEVYVVGQPDPLACTNDHPILVSHQKKRNGNRHWKYEESQQFEPAEGLVPIRDYVFVPKRKEIKPELSSEEAYVVGWYIGDGYLHNDLFTIVFSKKEFAQAQKVAEIIDRLHITYDLTARKGTKKTCTIKDSGTYYRLSKTSKYVAGLFRKYGGTANNKHYKLNCIYSAIGLIEAEGHLKKTPREAIEVGMNDENIIKHLRQVLIDHGIWSSYMITNKNLHKLTIPSRYAVKLCAYSTLYNLESKTVQDRAVTIETEDGFWTPVKKVQTQEKVTVVYNCEVEEDHTFVSNGFVTHNCMALLVGMYMMQEMYNTTVRPKVTTAHGDWFDRVYDGSFSPQEDDIIGGEVISI